ncbi:hypothetical protein SVIOM74S_02192 [Streptomyces violarus]
MPPSLRYFTELRENGGTLIVVDPRRTRTAEHADLHLAPRPGTDLALALGMLHLVVAEGRVGRGRTSRSGPPAGRTRGRRRWRTGRSTWSGSPGRPSREPREAVRLFCAPGAAMVLTARGPEQQAKGTDTVVRRGTGWPDRPVGGTDDIAGDPLVEVAGVAGRLALLQPVMSSSSSYASGSGVTSSPRTDPPGSSTAYG